MKSFREPKVPVTVYECIEQGEVARNMTMEECNEAVKGTFILTVKLEDNWGIWRHVGKHYTQNIYFNKGIAKDVNDMQMERLFKVFEVIRERNYY